MEKTDENSTVANGNCSPKEREDLKKDAFPKKVFVRRNSVLTDIMGLNHFQTVFNICVAICILLLLNAALYYLAAPHILLEDSKIMFWAIQKIPIFVLTWLGVNLASISIFKSLTLWADHRHKISLKVADFIFHAFCFLVYILMFTVTPYIVSTNRMPPITAFATLAEQVRMFMKCYSFVKENSQRVEKYDPKKDGEQKYLYPTFSHFMYYMFAPVLIYQDDYPRTKDIKWSFVIENFMKLLACVFIAFCIFSRFNIDVFKNVGLKQFPISDWALILAGCMGVGAIMMFLIFYAILHAWLNAFAEMLRFGDRLFYKDWWNSTSFSQYYRMWNGVVYDWLHRYIHISINKKGVNRWASMMTVFIVSAVAHEYIICFSLGFFYPVLAVVYSTVGVSVVFLTKSKTAQWWNTFMWAMLFSGWGCIIFLYSVEWYARQNCPRTEDGILDYFIPRSLNCHMIAATS